MTIVALLAAPIAAEAAPGHHPLWSLPPGGKTSRWALPVPRPGPRPPTMLPDPTAHADVDAALPPPPDFSVAPSVGNILNRRDDLSEDQTGAPGSGAGYLRSVGRTLGVAVKKSLY